MKYNRILFELLFISSLLSYTVMSAAPSPLGKEWWEVSLLQEIEQNNTTLITLRAEVEARKLENRTGVTLADPEIEYRHMWNGAEQSGNLTEFTIRQSFDLSTVLGYKSRVAENQNLFIDEEYRLVRMDILLETQLTCIDLAYYNALAEKLECRLAHARRVVEAERCRLESGDTDVLSYNNVVLNLSALEAERARVATEQSVLKAHLARLNGGKEIDGAVSLKTIDSLEPLDDIDNLVALAMQYNPEVVLARIENKVAKSELSLAKSQYLPTLSAAYINERHTIGDRSQGVSIGVSLPLWANKNRVRSARAALQAVESKEVDVQIQLRSQFQADYERIQGLYHTATLYRTALDESNNTELLARAMDEGLISVLEYLQGVELYYDYFDRFLSVEREYYRALAELEAWKL